MLLRRFIPTLAAAVYVCSGESHITFYPDGYTQQYGFRTGIDKYHQCYIAPEYLFNAVSDIKFENAEWFKWHFTLTVYSFGDCSGDFQQWQLDVGTYRSWSAGFVGWDMNDRIKSWKISDQSLGDLEGYSSTHDDPVYPSYDSLL